MKKLKCDLCDHVVQAKTFEAWMEAMKPHYASAHSEFMQQKSKIPKDKQMAEMQKWMADNKARFEAQAESK